ncbi:alpha/beta hydrolase [Mycobacteroides abscessus subsp. bolletii]|uniref:alpha/beta fold hydrolase n=1 Tax=Mycobacteroides abscessus TaxID=36809 RepID=UPI0019D27664|nr:alpha/beta hydrolase [Mycobacteroides abscessus]MBN7303149.1 alpha/beta hydrolase [Mycobacteroides abscessus subsp. bolletii]
MTSLKFSFRGDTMAYTRSGSGKPILFLHNGGTAKEIWTKQVQSLADRYEVICLDHLGFGESDMPEHGYTIFHYVDRLAAFIEHLGFERISVVGNCMGSAMTLLLAESRPELFDSLVLINPLSKNTARKGVIGWVMPVAERFPKLSMAIARRLRVPRVFTNLVVAAQFGPRNWLRGIVSPLPGTEAAGRGWADRGRLASMAEMFASPETLGAVDMIQPGPTFPPFAIVWGDSNLGLSPEAGRKLNRTLRPDRVDFLSKCGHLPMMEAPDTVTAIIDEFVSRPPIRTHGSAEAEHQPSRTAS